jgi:uncharacterized repeat protein (TIGR02543 family)
MRLRRATQARRVRALIAASMLALPVLAITLTSLPASASTHKTTAPGAVRSVHASSGPTKATVTWSPPSSDGGAPITKYTATSHPQGRSCTTAQTKCVISGLTSSTSYEFTVVAHNKVAAGPTSKPSNPVTPASAPVVTPPPSTTGSSSPTTTTTTPPPPPSGGGTSGGGGGTPPTSYTVTFNANGGTGTMPSETESSATALTPNTFTRAGYTFNGWNTAQNASGEGFADRQQYSFSSSTTLFAEWTIISYTITFNSNGGTGTMANEVVTGTSTLSSNLFTRSSYGFAGWSSTPDNSGTSFANNASITPTSSITLYAQWSTSIYTVTFDPNGASGSMAPESGASPTTLTLNAFTRPGYAFTGWSTSSGDSSVAYSDGSSYSFSSSVVLFAQWQAVASPVITLQPSDQIVTIGHVATFSASATGPTGTTIRWYQSSNGGSTWASISGATQGSYNVTSSLGTNDYQYEAVFTDAGGSTTSSPATLVNLEASGNWSGYVATGQVYTAVSAEWTVPTVTCSGSDSSFAVEWVGIDGANSPTVEQDGTETNCVAGSPQYAAWYEMFGDAAVNNGYLQELSSSTYPVSPGDLVSSSVSVTDNVWTLQVTDTTQNWTFETTITDSAPEQSSAEVVVESPEVCYSTCSTAAPADFASVAFSSISLSASGTPEALTASNYYAMALLSDVVPLAAPGDLSGGGSSFTDTWYSGS